MTTFDFAQQTPPRRTRLRLAVWILCALIVAYASILAVNHLSNATISVVNRITHGSDGTDRTDDAILPISEDPEYTLPKDDATRLDILVLGIRGKGDAENGGLLTDTILLFSLDKATGKASLISVPRDLTVRITDERTEKINAAYAHYGVSGTKKLYSRILGVSIDNIVVADFDAFKSVVDTLGGITITLDKPFTEKQQWGYEFSLPQGINVLDGDQALYYSRSRYSTSDFDRSRRQMQVLMAIKDKASALSLTSDPIRMLGLVTTIRRHIETDLNILDLGTMRDLLAQQDKLGRIKRYQLTTENVLYETVVDGVYELLPRDNTLSHIQQFVRTVLTDAPVLPTPAPTETSPRASTLTPATSPSP